MFVWQGLQNNVWMDNMNIFRMEGKNTMKTNAQNFITTNENTTNSKIANKVKELKDKFITFFEDHFVAMIYLGVILLNAIGFGISNCINSPVFFAIISIPLALIDVVALVSGLILLGDS
jgi:hypothetical protein